jgi:hypothetical protein
MAFLTERRICGETYSRIAGARGICSVSVQLLVLWVLFLRAKTHFGLQVRVEGAATLNGLWRPRLSGARSRIRRPRPGLDAARQLLDEPAHGRHRKCRIRPVIAADAENKAFNQQSIYLISNAKLAPGGERGLDYLRCIACVGDGARASESIGYTLYVLGCRLARRLGTRRASMPG